MNSQQIEILSLIVAYDVFKYTHFEFNRHRVRLAYSNTCETSIKFSPPTPLHPVTKAGVFVCSYTIPVALAYLGYKAAHIGLNSVNNYFS